MNTTNYYQTTKSPSFGGVGEANRNEAYFSIIEKLPKKRKRIFKCIEQNPNSTAFEISTRNNIPINEVVPRITELKNVFMITESGSKTSQKSKKQNTLYRTINDIGERIDLINARFVELRTEKEALESDYILGVSRFTRKMIDTEIRKIKQQIHFLEKVISASLNPSKGGTLRT